ncbi:elongation factor 4 [Puniceicoccales bacterium CK1056]|uniref:Elongation factor 4 n=1 Tax=Oceanipulchritudo coccoides TaxID=2706888 RepID=A0A6B2M0E2_9BACT|nr:translation elongation factor 4 [Oceanipulchritudo coccoides]NDV61862.1 elongation factor 4 [Oceanipulchritudo coccoides]
MSKLSKIRNFCIIAHIDHGKTTLSDRLLEATQTVSARDMQAQLLDSMDLERERGITIKSHPVTLKHKAADGIDYIFNLIDTPGHVDFSYEVSRSLTACEGALLLVDAAQGIEAQTVANAHLALDLGMEVIPVINKIDLPGSDIPLVKQQLEDILAIPADEAILASAKAGKGIPEIMEAIIQRVPPPRWGEHPHTRTLIFDCVYDAYKGVICFVRVFSGTIKRGDTILMMSDGTKAEVKEVGIFSPSMKPSSTIEAGWVGYIVTNIKDVSEIKIGDTITTAANPATEMLPGYKEVRPMVFSGLYPIDTSDYEKLKVSMGKLQLNDSALVFTPESSVALGFGFRCGFLGLLHMEIVTERIRREYDLDIISTYPSVVYKVLKTDGTEIEVHNPVNMPDPAEITSISEPTIKATLHIPSKSIGDILALATEKRGYVDHTETLDESRVMMVAHLPLNEILVDFNDRLKSITKGYGSMDYELSDYQQSKLVRLDILVNGETVDAFSSIVHMERSEAKGRQLCEKLKEILPRQMFKIAIQASVGSKVVARETISALRKDVTAKCYGGDISRKRKLLEKQKEGKKRMKQIGKVSIPQEAFVDILKSTSR